LCGLYTGDGYTGGGFFWGAGVTFPVNSRAAAPALGQLTIREDGGRYLAREPVRRKFLVLRRLELRPAPCGYAGRREHRMASEPHRQLGYNCAAYGQPSVTSIVRPQRVSDPMQEQPQDRKATRCLGCMFE
jgi:hypothetical protein